MITSAPQHSGHSGPRRSAHHGTGRRRKTSPWLLLRQNPALALALLMALLVPLLPGPRPALPWDGASGAAFEAGGVLLLAAALWRADAAGLGRALAFARRGPTAWLLAFAAWAMLTCALASGGTAALQGALHLGAGLLVYGTVAYRVRRESDLSLALDVLSAATLLVSALALGSLLVTGAMEAGAFTHRSFGAVLMLLLPVALLSAGAPGTTLQRGAGQAAAVLGGLALLLSRWHPAERGALVAALVLGLACWRSGVRVWPTGGVTLWERFRATRDAAAASKRSPAARRRGTRSGHGAVQARRRAALSRALHGATLLGAAAVFLALTPAGSALMRQGRDGLARAAAPRPPAHAARAGSSWAAASGRLLRGVRRASAGAARGEAPEGRQSTRAILAMIEARPVLGVGLGCSVLSQKQWTHQGDAADAVRRHGPQAADRARSAALQMAAETGLPGLALWAAALAVFAAGAVRALRAPETSPLRRRVLIGCLAAVAGQAVDACSDGSWQFGGPSLFLWLVLGLGAAAAGGGTDMAQAGGGDGPVGAALAQAGWRVHLRFAGVCALGAVLLSLVVRASR